MSKITSIGTAVPEYGHQQEDILDFMERVYAPTETDKRKLKFLYHKGGIQQRFSVIPDYSLPASAWQFYLPTENLEPFPTLEQRMEWYQQYAPILSVKAINDCLGNTNHHQITHLITVSCTGMSAPGLDLQLIELLGLPATVFRTSINFMGCYAALHALKIADAFCKSDINARVLIVCTELCTLHFQKAATVDNITSSMLFADGAAAVLVSGDNNSPGLSIGHFYSYIEPKGKSDMAWQLSSEGFQMTLSSYVADLVEENFNKLVCQALQQGTVARTAITDWCIHPGGKKILEAVHNSLGFTNGQLRHSYEILSRYGNMSSPTVLFVLKEIMNEIMCESPDTNSTPRTIFSAAFGPGLTMETCILST